MPALRTSLALGSVLGGVNLISKSKKRRGFMMKIKLESMNTAMLKGRVSMPQQAAVVAFSTLIIFNKH